MIARISWAENAARGRAWLDELYRVRPRQFLLPLDAEEDDDCGTCGGDRVVEHEPCEGCGCDACDDTGDAPCPECAEPDDGIVCE